MKFVLKQNSIAFKEHIPCTAFQCSCNLPLWDRNGCPNLSSRIYYQLDKTLFLFLAALLGVCFHKTFTGNLHNAPCRKKNVCFLWTQSHCTSGVRVIGNIVENRLCFNLNCSILNRIPAFGLYTTLIYLLHEAIALPL